MTPDYGFPSYGAAEVAADKVIHGIGLSAAVAALVWLWLRLPADAPVRPMAALALYSAGLLSMLSASALYNFTRFGRWKARFRRLDHAMIFVMIAGSYTPFVLLALRPGLGVPIFLLVWAIAIAGVVMKLTVRRSREILSLALYLGMGWLVLGFVRPLAASLPHRALLCLVLGGIVYSLGAAIHRLTHVRYHNVAWHGLVVCAAGLHLAAVAQILPAG